ncbi:hypothetical protein M3Y96_00995600 [Aphelenchoides besseyi]|nr:hypothetical protein M3Y96_00995600 [Aphelenchoides besseyi]
MNLIGRIWNFLFGFLAFYLQEFWRGRTEVPNEESAELLHCEKKSVLNRLSDVICNLLLPSILIIFVVYEATSNRQVNRFLIVLLTMLNIAISTDSLVLTNSLLVAVGDISYSIYLVHWPIFEYFRYAFVEVDFYSRYASPAAGLFLIFVSLALGQLIEELFKHIGKLMTTWKVLLFTISIFYLAIGGMLQVLKSSELDFTIHSGRLPSNYTKVLADATRFHETFDEDVKPLTSSESLTYTRDFAEVILRADWFCDKQVRHTPINYKSKHQMGQLSSKQCTVTDGKGTKTIVVFGNSFARNYMPGCLLEHHASFAKRLHRQYSHCKRERSTLIPVLKQWKYPIDIIIFGQAFNNHEPERHYFNLSVDEIYIEMQSLFDELNEIARDVILFPLLQYNNGIDAYMKILERKLAIGQDLNIFKTPIKFVRNFRRPTRRRLAAVECSKCAKIEMEDLWCRKQEGYCNAVDFKRRLGLFYDYYHPNLYGSLFIGKFLRVNYDRWIANHNLTH